MKVIFTINDKPVELDLPPVIGTCPLEEVSSDYLVGWRKLLAEPYLVDQSIAVETLIGIFLAVPVGKFRISGSFDFCCDDSQRIVDILKNKPGFPNLRISQSNLVEWGEDSDKNKMGECYGYCSEEIQKFYSDVLYKSPLREHSPGRRMV